MVTYNGHNYGCTDRGAQDVPPFSLSYSPIYCLVLASLEAAEPIIHQAVYQTFAKICIKRTPYNYIWDSQNKLSSHINISCHLFYFIKIRDGKQRCKT